MFEKPFSSMERSGAGALQKPLAMKVAIKVKPASYSAPNQRLKPLKTKADPASSIMIVAIT
jgi:hypothetical protein